LPPNHINGKLKNKRNEAPDTANQIFFLNEISGSEIVIATRLNTKTVRASNPTTYINAVQPNRNDRIEKDQYDKATKISAALPITSKKTVKVSLRLDQSSINAQSEKHMYKAK
jgi:hypothetical protein